ncbi:uncharacterized protein Z519_08333 [Cladophialophora bantiana CBS 173.52]|uniref:Uncharacterized protein n=1 Tax=Cladophialophora bantiana (strain ATCC 10958 / CBS 173.52 / CDC B-1940 / NIH 8579) TaxID=1442370 RepID=A0A0D2FYA1_CLAB1|nr:uncharacterized protein Z519_08333 [Cladophialophora bantiana CBS 173.52]KIW91437.1 hypothetical protein Z519_08333 [Cladophialophora bantiana CBS 173.52]
MSLLDKPLMHLSLLPKLSQQLYLSVEATRSPSIEVSSFEDKGSVRAIMAPLRSSRSTRNQEHNPTPRNRAGLPDFDVTEGLPVRRWERVSVKISQDAPADQADGNDQSTENNDGNFPWTEHPLPSYWPLLPPHNQEMVRRARMGNTNAKLSVWDPKTESYIPGIELERREAARKAQLSKSKHTHTSNVDAINVDDEEDKNEEDNDDLMDVDGLGPDPKRRKATHGSNERVFEIKKWVQIPAAVAEKMPEPKYLADRRPGMESLYKGAYKATNGFGTLGDMTAGDMVVAVMTGRTTGYDLGDGSGLGNAAGILAPGSGPGAHTAQPDGTATPVRKNMPPRRKKKKIGGPGRKPKNPNPEPSAAATASAATTTVFENAAADDAAAASTVDGDVTMRNTPETAGEGAENADGTTPALIEGEASTQAYAEGSGSESDGEGSEEGEIASVVVAAAAAPATAPADAAAQEFILSKAVQDAATAEAGGAPEEEKDKKEEEEAVVPAVAAAGVSLGAVDPDLETGVDADTDANAVPPSVPPSAPPSAPVIEQEANKKQHEGEEIDVLGALEAAVDKEAGEDA